MTLPTSRAAGARTLPHHSLQPVLRHILDGVAPVLLDDAGRQALLDCAGTFPDVLSRHSLGLELRLQGPLTGTLVLAAVPTAPDGQRLHRTLTSGALDGDPAMRALARTLSDWRAPDSWLARSCGSLRLELDASRAADGEPPPPPRIYLVPRGGNDDNDSSARAQNAFHADPFGVLGALAAISGASVDHRTCYEFKFVLEALAGSADLVAAGAMLSRESRRAPRVTFRRFTARDVKPFLKTIGRKNAAKMLSPVAKALARPSTNLCISLNLSPESGSVGLEVYADGSLSAGDPGGWEALLTALVDRNLADADRADAVLKLLSAGREEHPRTGLSHVTITTADGALAPTKVYLADLT